MSVAISVDHLVKHFGAFRAVDDISFSVQEGELFGFLGPNGAGKTTTIRCLMDFLRPTTGGLQVFGQDAQKDSVAIKAQVGYVPSDPHLYESWTGTEHVAFVQKLRGKGKDDEAVLSQLGGELGRKVKYLSTGNKQKLVLALGFLGDPKLVVLDEPTRGLDPIFQRAVEQLLREFCANGGTVFLSSHNLSEVEHLCSRVAIIRRGKLAAVEGLAELRGKAVHMISVGFGEDVAAQAFKLPNIEIIHAAPRHLKANVSGDLTPFLAVLGKQNVTDLEVTHASLEEVFLRFYG